MDDLTLDLDRADRCGHPEVIFGEGKMPETVVTAIGRLREAGQSVLVTRTDSTQRDAAAAEFSDLTIAPVGRTIRWQAAEADTTGDVVVATAGTGDMPVAVEAAETLRWMDVGCELIADIGVAGPQRLLDRVDRLRQADAVVVVAGMEGALPSVVGGWLSRPVIACPTSVGYGASLGGIAALLGMLNSCAANVTCVNIDAGFKAGYVAGLIARAGSE